MRPAADEEFPALEDTHRSSPLYVLYASDSDSSAERMGANQRCLKRRAPLPPCYPESASGGTAQQSVRATLDPCSPVQKSSVRPVRCLPGRWRAPPLFLVEAVCVPVLADSHGL